MITRTSLPVKPRSCGTIEQADKILSDYREEIVFSGLRPSTIEESGAFWILSLNPFTQTWSLLTIDSRGTVCIRDTGIEATSTNYTGLIL
jgi:hypothetical protein